MEYISGVGFWQLFKGQVIGIKQAKERNLYQNFINFFFSFSVQTFIVKRDFSLELHTLGEKEKETWNTEESKARSSMEEKWSKPMIADI